MAMFVIYGVA